MAAELGREAVHTVLELYARTQSLQRRLFAILTDLVQSSSCDSVDSSPRVSPFHFLIIYQLPHIVVLTRSSASCGRCLSGDNGSSAINMWMGRPCEA